MIIPGGRRVRSVGWCDVRRGPRSGEALCAEALDGARDGAVAEGRDRRRCGHETFATPRASGRLARRRRTTPSAARARELRPDRALRVSVGDPIVRALARERQRRVARLVPVPRSHRRAAAAAPALPAARRPFIACARSGVAGSPVSCEIASPGRPRTCCRATARTSSGCACCATTSSACSFSPCARPPSEAVSERVCAGVSCASTAQGAARFPAERSRARDSRRAARRYARAMRIADAVRGGMGRITTRRQRRRATASSAAPDRPDADRADEGRRGPTRTSSPGTPRTAADMLAALDGADAVSNAASHRLNLPVLQACLESGAHTTISAVSTLRDRAYGSTRPSARLGSAAISMGAAPGITNMLAAAARRRARTVESIEVLDSVVAGRAVRPRRAYVPAYPPTR